MQPELELDDDSEVAATAAQAPEQVGGLIGGRAHDVAARSDDGAGHDVVAGETLPARQPAPAAAPCQPAAGDVRDAAGRCRDCAGPTRTAPGVKRCGGA